MIEKDVIQSPFYLSLEGTFLELKSVIRTLHFIEEKTQYEQFQKGQGTSLFTLQSRTEKQSSRPVQSGLQKGLTISYLYRYGRLSVKQQRFSFKSQSAYTIIYAKDTEPNSESHKEPKPSVRRSYRRGANQTVRRATFDYESNKSRALQNDEKPVKRLNLIELKLNSKKLLVLFCFIGFRTIKILGLDLNFMRVKELKINSFESTKKPNAITHFSYRPLHHYIEL